MQTLIFDVMVGGHFIMQHKFRYSPLFKIDFSQILEEILERRPSLRGKHIELYQTTNRI